jgi:GH24 family phage-related lysozyme (muramidase)
MLTSLNGYQFIRDREGLTLVVRPDANGRMEIGYGHDLLQSESYPNGITAAYAELLLRADVARDEVHVNAGVTMAQKGCTQNQFDALTDFTYECGPEALLELLSHGWAQIVDQLPRWVYTHVKGVAVELPGMVERRRLEVELFVG